MKKVRTKKDIENDPRVDELIRGAEHGMINAWYIYLQAGYWSQEGETTMLSCSSIADACWFLNNDVEIDPRPKNER